ncbi:hypothetical protein [Psychrobacter pygoscelis]|uniref:hypothetical protein n=1 Tax=Psychrobacter pygoscelis TaxID=2488563 RepID=UPI0013F49F6D|nr:hypothetical protein [Psychrobacter pygoscelis]
MCPLLPIEAGVILATTSFMMALVIALVMGLLITSLSTDNDVNHSDFNFNIIKTMQDW